MAGIVSLARRADGLQDTPSRANPAGRPKDIGAGPGRRAGSPGPGVGSAWRPDCHCPCTRAEGLPRAGVLQVMRVTGNSSSCLQRQGLPIRRNSCSMKHHQTSRARAGSRRRHWQEDVDSLTLVMRALGTHPRHVEAAGRRLCTRRRRRRHTGRSGGGEIGARPS